MRIKPGLNFIKTCWQDCSKGILSSKEAFFPFSLYWVRIFKGSSPLMRQRRLLSRGFLLLPFTFQIRVTYDWGFGKGGLFVLLKSPSANYTRRACTMYGIDARTGELKGFLTWFNLQKSVAVKKICIDVSERGVRCLNVINMLDKIGARCPLQISRMHAFKSLQRDNILGWNKTANFNQNILRRTH